ncbi:MAG: OmpH family outer membrane protein [Cyclobacteriaceae bacterium]|nr:OmpH family outer membrane protein [Cyclobacteriaceae bacterium]MDH4295622.1 OmpH family outer membrane protein [Cyclobacteriaceae bacterium]MDH5248974.1 OmpH family outer membrane protein [Cyclobacteriaceae bacterium]
MKNLSLILNAVLLVAVGVLFYLHFSGGKPSDASSAGVNPGDLQIAYINSDSVLKNYDYLKVNRVQLEEKTKKMDQDYRNRAMGLQNEIAAYQRNVSSMTLGQVRATEEDLGKKQQNLQLFQQSLSQQLMDEEAKLNKELYDRITAFLKKYGSEKGLQIVLKFDPTSDVLFAGEALDISKDVIAGLNAAYQDEKSGGAVKADTTATK